MMLMMMIMMMLMMIIMMMMLMIVMMMMLMRLIMMMIVMMIRMIIMNNEHTNTGQHNLWLHHIVQHLQKKLQICFLMRHSIGPGFSKQQMLLMVYLCFLCDESRQLSWMVNGQDKRASTDYSFCSQTLSDRLSRKAKPGRIQQTKNFPEDEKKTQRRPQCLQMLDKRPRPQREWSTSCLG